jgi:hypothetical protein
MMRRTVGVLLTIGLICAVSCTRQKQQEQSRDTKQLQHEQSAECGSLARVPYHDFELLICGNGDQFTADKEKQWTGDGIKIYKQQGKEKTLLRDFAETALGSSYGVTIETKDDSLMITISSDDYPDWKVAPLFTEVIRLDSGVSTITPLVPVLPYDPKTVEKLWADIDKNESDMFSGQAQEDTHFQTFFDLAYTNLFKLRNYAFHNPEEVEKKLKDLRKWDWNDGEVAEVYSQILSQVSYMKGKQVILK